MSTVRVLHLVNDTVVDETHTAERITFQHFPDGRAQVRLYRGDEVAQYVSYRQAERIHRIDAELEGDE